MLVIWNRVIWRPPHTALGQERAHSDHFAAAHIASTILKQGFVWKVELFIQSQKKSKLHQNWDIFQFNYKFAQFTLSSLKICSKCLMRNPWLDGRTSAQAEQTPLIHTAASYIFNANRIEAFHSPCSIMMVGVGWSAFRIFRIESLFHHCWCCNQTFKLYIFQRLGTVDFLPVLVSTNAEQASAWEKAVVPKWVRNDGD